MLDFHDREIDLDGGLVARYLQGVVVEDIRQKSMYKPFSVKALGSLFLPP
jgi:hypothetical protein